MTMPIVKTKDYHQALVESLAEAQAKIEQLREIIQDALDDEVALRMMPKWCRDARATLEQLKE